MGAWVWAKVSENGKRRTVFFVLCLLGSGGWVGACVGVGEK